MEIGQKVLFDEKYIRTETRNTDGDYKRNWTIKKVNRTKGIFVGVRSIKDVRYSFDCYDSEEHAFNWKVTKYIKVALIAVNKKQLIYVPFESIIKDNTPRKTEMKDIFSEFICTDGLFFNRKNKHPSIGEIYKYIKEKLKE